MPIYWNHSFCNKICYVISPAQADIQFSSPPGVWYNYINRYKFAGPIISFMKNINSSLFTSSKCSKNLGSLFASITFWVLFVNNLYNWNLNSSAHCAAFQIFDSYHSMDLGSFSAHYSYIALKSRHFEHTTHILHWRAHILSTLLIYCIEEPTFWAHYSYIALKSPHFEHTTHILHWRAHILFEFLWIIRDFSRSNCMTESDQNEIIWCHIHKKHGCV